MRPKVLIIKTGYSETLQPEISKTCSLGDVLRTTVILNYLEDHHVTWLVDAGAKPLLTGIKAIDEILEWNPESISRLESEIFDWVINLEKVPGICALSDRITSWRKSGFRFDQATGRAKAHVDTDRLLNVVNNGMKKKPKYWQSYLAESIRKKWNTSHGYFIQDQGVPEIHDVGMNFLVGPKWVNKAWHIKRWHKLGHLLEEEAITPSWQEGKGNLEDYINWIASCGMIITSDSLGLHLAIALGKKVVGIFGPTSPQEIYFYGLGESVVPSSSYGCIPCGQSECLRKTTCIDEISASEVMEVVRRIR